jgi:cardiolipin synthase
LNAETLAWTWYATGDAWFPAMLEAIGQARRSVRLETYIFGAAGIGLRVLEELTAAARRGVSVRVLVDGFGSGGLPGGFWQPLTAAGGDARVFNPIRFDRFGIRDHRKLMVCDDAVAFVGGFNIGPEYEGDGVTRGWRDVGLRLTGPPAAALGHAFDRMAAAAAFRRKPFARLRRAQEKRLIRSCGCEIILGGPGRGGSPLLRALRRDLARAHSVSIMVAYFLPTRRLWRGMMRAARRGADVRLLLPGRSDVTLSKLATESLYGRLLRAGVRIHEYQPRMLHGKLFILDDAVYVGSANLDPRSLRLNYELMVRIEAADVAEAARGVFEECLRHGRGVDRKRWKRGRSLWTRFKQRAAHLILARLDPWIALSQWRALPD